MYCSLADLKLAMPETVLLQLADDAGVGSFVETPALNNPALVVHAAITAADAVIDSYLAGRYAVPVSPVPEVLKTISTHLALCNLYLRRRELDLPEGIAAREKKFLAWLKDVREERADLPGAGKRQPGGYTTDKTEEDRLFSDELLNLY